MKNILKKILLFALALAISITSIPALGIEVKAEEQCNHRYYWTSNQNEHWQKCAECNTDLQEYAVQSLRLLKKQYRYSRSGMNRCLMV